MIKSHAFRNADQLDQDPLAGLGDLPLVLESKLQLFNYLRQPLSRKGVCGLQGEPGVCCGFRSNTTRLMRSSRCPYLPGII